MEYKYFKINNGYYFRYDEDNNHFEILKDDCWENDETLMSLYLDPIGYEEITDIDVILALNHRPKKETITK